MKDAYSLDINYEGLKKQYNTIFNAYYKIFNRVGLPVIDIQSDTGRMGGKVAHEFIYISPVGEDTIFIRKECGYKANREVASIGKEYIQKNQLALKKIYTPNAKSIEQLTKLLTKEASDFAKVVFYTGIDEETEKIIVAVVRGDMEANATKIQNKTKVKNLRFSTDEEINSINAIAGYASPIKINKEKTIVIVDDLVANTNNLIIGANQENYHFDNSCYGRDYEADIISDIVEAVRLQSLGEPTL